MANWIISKDNCGAGRVGYGTVTELNELKERHHFKIYCDDGTLDFEGYCDDAESEEAFEPLDWATWDVGSSYIEYRQPNGKYEVL